MDFGIAKVVDAGVDDKHKTTAGMVFGTPAYMSPEQAMGVEADARADLYSTGVLLYQMLAGRLPLDSEDPVALVRMQVAADPEPLPSSVPPVLSATVARFLKKDRDERFQTAHEAIGVLEALRAMLGGAEVQAVTAANTSGPIYVDSSRQIVVDPSGQILVDASGQIASVDPSSTSIPVGKDGRWKVARRRTFELRDRLITEIQRRPRWQAWAGGATVGALLLLFFVWVVGGEEGDPSEQTAEVSEPGTFDGDGATPQEAGATPKSSSVELAKLDEIDQLLLGNKADEAEALLAPLRDRFPDDAQLAWRQGHLLTLRKKKEPQALAEYAKALQNDATLLEDKLFYAQLHELMGNRRVRKEALDLALHHMGEHGHQFLLKEVNNAKRPLGYNDRQRALAELKQDSKNAPLIIWELNRSLNVQQAKSSVTPCKSYRAALEQIREAPDPAYLEPVETSPVPGPPDPEDTASQEKPADCEGLEEARIEVLALLAALEATEEEAEITVEEEPPPEEQGSPKTTKKRKKKSNKKKKKPASKPKDECKGIKKANPKCWGK